MLDHESVIPLYTQVYESLKKDIQSGKLKPRQRLPSEEKFSQQYGVSIITIRRAVSELAKEGLVEKKQGKGTFVSAPKYQKSFSSRVMSFTETCNANGLKAGARVLDLSMVEPDPETVERLQLTPGSQVLRILRLRYADDTPCVVEENFFPPEFDFFLDTNLEGESIYRILREERGIEILPGPLTLKIMRADKQVAEQLNVSRGTPLLQMTGLSYQDNGQVLHTCTQIGYGENFDFVLR